MQKQEFEERIERTVTDEQYKVIEEVYMWHPSIRNTSGKDEVAELYKSFGMTIFHDIQENPKSKGWAAGAGYGEKILKILDAIKETGSSQAGDGSPKPDETKKDDDFKEYLITTTCDVLNIRSGAGTDNKVVGAIREVAGKKNKYTIVEEKNGWGRLKSGAGWISLSYTKKVAASTGTTFTPYLITTTCDVLNIRSGAGTGYSVVGAIREVTGKKNKYTIVEEKNGWGRLKSGAGWISLSYTKKAS